MLVTKADGTVEEFDSRKLRQSLRNSGADKKTIEDIVTKIEAVIYDGMKTGDIYRQAFALLQTSPAQVTARYALRRALFGLGPTGFPFEKFLAKLFRAQGYKTKTGINLNGRCAVHEIDLAAYKSDHAFIAEAKFHARPGIKSDLQDAMYSYARLLDLSEQKICDEDICGVKNLKVITNTKFTHAATRYASCVGVDLLSWDYPKQSNLYELISEYKLYPITVLHSLNMSQKKSLLQADIIVVEDILERPKALESLNLSPKKTDALLLEARQLSSRA